MAIGAGSKSNRFLSRIPAEGFEPLPVIWHTRNLFES
jgi:hypothetical protein